MIEQNKTDRCPYCGGWMPCSTAALVAALSDAHQPTESELKAERERERQKKKQPMA